jgi:hypothetical protein
MAKPMRKPWESKTDCIADDRISPRSVNHLYNPYRKAKPNTADKAITEVF